MPAKPRSRGDSGKFLARALKAADWFTNSQIKCPRVWMSDHGRFLYYYFMPGKREVPGINWTHGRALFVLTDAYRIAGDKRYLESMELGGRYLRALQPLDPYYPVTYGSIREEIPQSPFGGVLDGAQAASGLLMLHTVTGNPDYLRRGRAFCDFLLRTWRPDQGLASRAGYYPERVEYRPKVTPWTCVNQASAIPLWHLFKITGEGQYLPPLVDAADRIVACQRADGGIYVDRDIRAIGEPPLNHHWGLGKGDERFLIRNDDGIVVVVLAAHQVTGDRKYLDAMVRYAEWTIANEPHERPYNAFGVQANNVLDIGKAAGKDYSAWVFDHLEKHCLKLQAEGTGDPKADGGFRGEDEEGNAGIFGGQALDYVPTRNTCYMAGLLFRLSGKGTGAGFSVWGGGA
ncbi:MAG: hypothetical protein V1809_11085 [Planctomycetota bacterium]